LTGQYVFFAVNGQISSLEEGIINPFAAELAQPQMMVVSDVDDIFLPLHKGLLVGVHEAKLVTTVWPRILTLV